MIQWLFGRKEHNFSDPTILQKIMNLIILRKNAKYNGLHYMYVYSMNPAQYRASKAFSKERR